MREIRFRAWTGSEMTNSFLLSEKGDIYLCGYSKYGASMDKVNWQLMQYTGLKDKNGKDIYEGDIVRYMYYSYNDGGMGNKMINKEVEYNELNASFNIGEIQDRLEIIGNIHENQELLEK